MLIKGGFHLTKWLSSSQALMTTIRTEDRFKPTLNLALDALPTEKTLGMFWDFERDQFVFKIRVMEEASTKRSIFTAASSIYDPLGLLSPVTLPVKILSWEQVRVAVLTQSK